MEIEPSSPQIAKKLWNIVRVVFYMLGKGLSKSKLMHDIHLMLKRGKLASKTLSDNMLHNHYAATLSCRSNDVGMSFISPREYEFSCSNSPAYPTYYTRRKHPHHHYHHHHQPRRSNQNDINVAKKIFEILNNYESVESSPMVNLPGFGRSPMVRQLRVTDSPFPIKDIEENTCVVDKAAEEFINNFYKELKQQNRIELPSPSNKRGR